MTESEETEITSVTETEGETESSKAETTEAVTTTAETTATTTAAVTTVTTAPSAKAPATQKYIDMIKNENFYYSCTQITSVTDTTPIGSFANGYENGNFYCHLDFSASNSAVLTIVIKNDGTHYVKNNDGVHESKASENEMNFSNVLTWELRPALDCTYTSSGIESFAGTQADYDLYTSPDGSELKIFHNNGNVIGIVSKIKNSSGAFEDIPMIVDKFTTKIPAGIFDKPSK